MKKECMFCYEERNSRIVLMRFCKHTIHIHCLHKRTMFNDSPYSFTRYNCPNCLYSFEDDFVEGLFYMKSYISLFSCFILIFVGLYYAKIYGIFRTECQDNFFSPEFYALMRPLTKEQDQIFQALSCAINPIICEFIN
jgi:hypothetical protein